MKHGIRGFRDKPRKQRLITSAKNQSRPRWLGEKWPWPPHPVRKINALNWESVTHNNLMGGWCHEVIPLIMWNGRVINGCPIARKVCRSVGTEKNVHLFPPVTLIRNSKLYTVCSFLLYILKEFYAHENMTLHIQYFIFAFFYSLKCTSLFNLSTNQLETVLRNSIQ